MNASKRRLSDRSCVILTGCTWRLCSTHAVLRICKGLRPGTLTCACNINGMHDLLEKNPMKATTVILLHAPVKSAAQRERHL